MISRKTLTIASLFFILGIAASKITDDNQNKKLSDKSTAIIRSCAQNNEVARKLYINCIEQKQIVVDCMFKEGCKIKDSIEKYSTLEKNNEKLFLEKQSTESNYINAVNKN